MVDSGPFRFTLNSLSPSNPFLIDGCAICGKVMSTKFGIHGQSTHTSFWLRNAADDALLICGDEVCFNMVVLSFEKYIKIPF